MSNAGISPLTSQLTACASGTPFRHIQCRFCIKKKSLIPWQYSLVADLEMYTKMKCFLIDSVTVFTTSTDYECMATGSLVDVSISSSKVLARISSA